MNAKQIARAAKIDAAARQSAIAAADERPQPHMVVQRRAIYWVVAAASVRPDDVVIYVNYAARKANA